MLIHERIKSRRIKLGFTLEDVAKKIGVSISTVQRYETKDIENMGIDKLEKLSNALECSPAYLMGWSDNVNDKINLDSDYAQITEEAKRKNISPAKLKKLIDVFDNEEE